MNSISRTSMAGAALAAAAIVLGCSPDPGPEGAPNAAQEALCPHEVPARLCPICTPGVRSDPAILLCREHGGIPEDICTACHPELKAKYRTCPHDLPRAFCAECGGPGAAPADGSLPLVRLATEDVARKAGIETAPAEEGSVPDKVTAIGEAAYDETRLAVIRPRVAGLLREVRAVMGDQVEKGQVLAVLDSAELGSAKADYLGTAPLVDLLEENLERQRALGKVQIVPARDILESSAALRRAEAEAMKAAQRLRNFGLGDRDFEALPREAEDERNLLRILAPIEGTVIRRKAVAGEAVGAEAELFAVADLSTSWVELDLHERDLMRVAVGQPVIFRVEGLAPLEFKGKVISIETQVNDRTRTIRVRAEVENAGGALRARMFGTGEIEVSKPKTSLLVPEGSLQWEGTSFVVFVKKGPALFEPRRVILGERRGGRRGGSVAIATAELRPGEEVVTTGSFLLKTEIQKGSIGAGCCGD